MLTELLSGQHRGALTCHTQGWQSPHRQKTLFGTPRWSQAGRCRLQKGWHALHKKPTHPQATLSSLKAANTRQGTQCEAHNLNLLQLLDQVQPKKVWALVLPHCCSVLGNTSNKTSTYRTGNQSPACAAQHEATHKINQMIYCCPKLLNGTSLHERQGAHLHRLFLPVVKYSLGVLGEELSQLHDCRECLDKLLLWYGKLLWLDVCCGTVG